MTAMTTRTSTAVAAELHRIADAIGALSPDRPDMYVNLSLSTSSSADVSDEMRMALVDALASALLDQKAELNASSISGKLSYGANRFTPPVFMNISDTISDPAELSELQRLRAEVAELRRASDQSTVTGQS